jgi:hypothetical protein
MVVNDVLPSNFLTPKLPSHFPCTEHPDTGVKLGIKVLNAPCSSILRPSPGGVGKQRRKWSDSPKENLLETGSQVLYLPNIVLLFCLAPILE